MSVYQPVRDARRVWHERYSEQLCFSAEDIAPWLIELPEPTTPLGRSRVFPRNGERGSGSPFQLNGHRPQISVGERAAGGSKETF